MQKADPGAPFPCPEVRGMKLVANVCRGKLSVLFNGKSIVLYISVAYENTIDVIRP